NFANGVVDLVGFAEGTCRRPSGELAVHVDYATGVGDIVRRVEDVALLELVAVTLLEELVVRRAGNDLALELWNRAIVDDRPERARREDVGLHAVDLFRADSTRTEFTRHALHTIGVDVGDDQFGS